MATLLFKKTTDNDLSEGQKVAYKDKSGEYSLTGTIRQSWIDSDGITRLYSLIDIPGAYMANELKLIEETLCNSFDELRSEVLKTGRFVEVSYELFDYSLCVLPPIWLKNGTFQVDEEWDNNLFYTFGEKDGKYYGCLCNKNFSINNF